jgi:pSer/pThr/pTyr-binding forkhead associated (FHA) protein
LIAELHVLTGGRAGAWLALERDTATLGRHPRSDLRFDPAMDLAVSALHAVVTRDGDRWVIQDLESTNGTFLDGQRLTGSAPLRPGDRIGLGADGPVVEFRISGVLDTPATARVEAASNVDAARSASDPPTGERVRIAVAKQTRTVKLTVAATAFLVFCALAFTLVTGRRDRAAWELERSQLRERVDSMLVDGEAAVLALQLQLSTLSEALQLSQAQVRQTRGDLNRARERGDAREVRQLERKLDDATETLNRQNSAAMLDFRSIQRQNRRAIALVYVESATGEMSTGTAFAVREDATLITNRHVVLGSDSSRPPRRLAVQFSDSDQVWPARLVAASRDADIAVIKIDNIAGIVPVVQGFNLRPDSLPDGAPVALIGFPNGGEGGTPSGTDHATARPVLGTGAISRSSATRLDVEGYGAAGASGSPVFDADGLVVGVLFGGPVGGGQVVYAVPAPLAVRLLANIP